jgi:hypothetical protein
MAEDTTAPMSLSGLPSTPGDTWIDATPVPRVLPYATAEPDDPTNIDQVDDEPTIVDLRPRFPREQ